MEFSRQEHWSGLPFPSPRDLPDPGRKESNLDLRFAGRLFTIWAITEAKGGGGTTSSVMLMRGRWESAKGGGWLPHSQLSDQRAGTSSPLPWPPREERGWRPSAVSNGQWSNQSFLRNEAPIKIQDGRGSQLSSWWTLGNGGGGAAPGKSVDHLWPLPTPCSMPASHQVAPELCPFIIIGALVSKMFLWVLWAALTKYNQTQGGDCGNLWFTAR